MTELKNNPTLKEYQDYIALMVKERGFDKETTPERFMLLLEECGEFAKAARKHTSVPTDKNSQSFDLAQEAADVFVLLLDICNHFDIDLEKAFREKEEVNKRRNWN